MNICETDDNKWQVLIGLIYLVLPKSCVLVIETRVILSPLTPIVLRGSRQTDTGRDSCSPRALAAGAWRPAQAQVAKVGGDQAVGSQRGRHSVTESLVSLS